MLPSRSTTDAIASLPERERRAADAAVNALKHEPLTASWAALAAALDFAAPPPSRDTWAPSTAMPELVLNDRRACAAMALLAVRALRRRVLVAASRAEPDWRSAAFREHEGSLLSSRYRGLARRDLGWDHVEDLRNMLPALAGAERPVAALAARLLEDRKAWAWWGLHEHELRAALEPRDSNAAAVPGQPDDVRATVEQARRALAERLGVNPQQVLIMVAL